MASIGETTDLQQLLRNLEKQKAAYDDALWKVQERIASAPTSSPEPRHSSLPRSPRSPPPLELKSRVHALSSELQTLESSSRSRMTGDESDDEDDQNLYAQDILPQEHYGNEAFREHLSNYKWDEYGKQVLHSLIEDRNVLRRKVLILPQQGHLEDRSDYTDYQVFDVGNDGAPLLLEVKNENTTNKPTALWQTIKDVNPDSRQRKAVGRITIVREPAPALFGALHYTMHKHFDVDELFRHLVEAESSSCHLNRAFDADPRRQRSFVVNLEYFTLIGEDCQPMKWQMADLQEARKPDHIAITRCSSVVALSLGGKAIQKLRNPDRRAGTAHGFAYDPWAAYHILNVQCYPDWNSSLDVHNSTHHYVNGVEAFLVTVLSEYKDAEKRFDDIYKRITRLITPPLEFMFDSEIRDRLLFEDDQYTYSRRYFWAFQTLGIMIDSMKAIIDAYEDNFTDEVWEGRHRTLWPLLDPDSPRNRYYKKKLSAIRVKFEQQLVRIHKLIKEYEARRIEIRSLRDQLFSGTSVMESRKSVEQAEITVQQGHNIKLLTLVNIFFLPLSFVTSVFGMTNMPQNAGFWKYAIVTVTICLPCFVLVASLNTTRGMHFWRSKLHAAWKRLSGLWSRTNPADDELPTLSRSTTITNGMNGYPLQRGISKNERMAIRLRRLSSGRGGNRLPTVETAKVESNVVIEKDGAWGETQRMRPRKRTSEMVDAGPSKLARLLRKEVEKQHG